MIISTRFAQLTLILCTSILCSTTPLSPTAFPSKTSPSILPPSTAYSPLSRLVFHQREPACAAADWSVLIGYMTVVGGVGPYSFTSLSNSVRFPQSSQPFLYPSDTIGSGPQSFKASVTDGVGETVTGSFVVQTVSTNLCMMFIHEGYDTDNVLELPINSLPPSYGQQLFTLRLFGDSLVSMSLKDPSKQWSVLPWYPNQIAATWRSISVWPYAMVPRVPAGNYPIILHVETAQSGTLHLNKTIVISKSPQIGPIAMYGVPVVLSTSLQPVVVTGEQQIGDSIGRAITVTSTNEYSWSLSGPDAASFILNRQSGVVTVKRPLSARQYSISLTVTERNVSKTQAFSMNIVQGNILHSSSITISVNLNLDNYELNQVVGTAQISGFNGGQGVWSVSTPDDSWSDYPPCRWMDLD